MNKRKLGKSNIEITPIGLGTWQFSQGKGFVGGFWKSLDRQTTQSVVQAAIEGGINWFDTAEMYGNGRSERGLAEALATLKTPKGSVKIATKWWPLLRSAGNIKRTISRRLDCLAPYPIDLYQIHQPFSFSSVEKQAVAMGRLVVAGTVAAVGVSNFSASDMERAHAVLAKQGIPLVSNQVRISLMDRSIESNGLLEAAKRLGITLIGYSPLAQGLLTGRFHDDPSAVESVSRMRRMSGSIKKETIERTAPLIAELRKAAIAHGVTPSQVALNWLISYWGEVVVAIPGASSPSQATAAADAMTFELSPDEIRSIDEESRKL
jgi:aryl-alcohol dehydrogenase-like predicted oxidoreductase